MVEPLRVGKFEIYWMEGGRFQIDGGSMFGVVPKVLWQKKWSCTDDNYITLADSAMLVRTPHGDVVIESGLGNKLTEKQQQIFRLQQPWDILGSLSELGLQRDDISHVLLTHGDFDHAGGVTMVGEGGELELTFPQARHYLQEQEWEDITSPNRRSASTYWPANFAGLQPGENLELVKAEVEVVPGVHLVRSGGHTRGHQVVWLESEGQHALHMGDLLPNIAYGNPLWITAYDNYPLDSIAAKEQLLVQALEKDAWLLLYHDPQTHACKFDERGKLMASWEENND